MNLPGSVSHPLRIRFASILSIPPVHGLAGPFLGGAKWTRSVLMFVAVAVLLMDRFVTRAL
eukprot:1997452-Prymnesium_polylepis.1